MNIRTKIYTRFPALESRDYILFLTGQFVSVIGTWMQATILPYIAYRITGRPFDLGLIGFSNTLPTLLFALPAGVFVEHWDKRKAVIILQSIMSIQAFGLAYLTFTNHIQIWHIVFLAFFYGTAVAIEVTARQAMLIELAGKEALPNAIALQTTAFNLGRVLGPLAAAWLLSTTGTAASVFLANGVSFVFVVIGLLFARTRFKVEKEAENERGMAGQFQEGLGYIRTNSVILAIIIMSSLLGFFGIPLLQQIPALARDVITPVLTTETLVATRTSQLYAAQGAGAVVAALMAASLNSINQNKLLVAGQIGFIVPIIALGLIHNINVALVLLFLIGWGTVTQLVMMNTMIQIQVPNELRGRVFSLYFWALQGVAPFGSIVIGWMAQNWGVPFAAISGGLICFFGTVIISVLFRNRSKEKPKETTHVNAE